MYECHICESEWFVKQIHWDSADDIPLFPSEVEWQQNACTHAEQLPFDEWDSNILEECRKGDYYNDYDDY